MLWSIIRKIYLILAEAPFATLMGIPKSFFFFCAIREDFLKTLFY